MDNGRAIVVMGVSGCGKTSVAEGLAASLGYSFLEGDRLHPPQNVAKMAGGVPLTDEDRQSWLDAVGARIAASIAEGRAVVAACSALKRIYRDRLRSFDADLRFLSLAVEPAEAKRRVAARSGHFMPASLVDSQFAALEPPQPDEAATTVDAIAPVAEIVSGARALLSFERSAGLT